MYQTQGTFQNLEADWLTNYDIINLLCLILEFRWCCLSEAELRKCKVLANVTSQMTPLALARLACVYGESVGECIRMVDNGFADVITLGDEQIYSAGLSNLVFVGLKSQFGIKQVDKSQIAVVLTLRN